MVETMSLLKEILEPSNKESGEKLDTRDMPELESKESETERTNQ